MSPTMDRPVPKISWKGQISLQVDGAREWRSYWCDVAIRSGVVTLCFEQVKGH